MFSNKIVVKPKTKYIFISGGVISGLGKGTISATLSTLIKSCGLKVFPIKADMYLNIDAGTMNPLEHGETFVTADALECDQDLGTYERFLQKDLGRKNYFTAGQIYQSLLNKERQLKYNGKCVEAFPHIPLEVNEFINRFPDDTDVAIIEFGGTVGEYQNEAFFEAARMMATAAPRQVCFIHVGYVIAPSSLGELKSKPMQMSIRELNQLGIFPDVVICRGEQEIDAPRLEKIALTAGLTTNEVFSCPNVKSVYTLPSYFHKNNILKPIFKKLEMKEPKPDVPEWEALTKKLNKIDKELKVAICGKYYSSGEYNLSDSYISVIEALKHACWYHNVNPKIVWFDSEKFFADPNSTDDLKDMDAVIVPQGWGSRGSDGKLKTIQYARENKIPYLGLCYGMQMASIEFARNVVGLTGANSEEVDPKTPHPIIHIMEDQKSYLQKRQFGGTIRLGAWPCKLVEGTLTERTYAKYSKLPKNLTVEERHRHRYEFNNAYREQLEAKGFVFSGMSPDGNLVEAIELPETMHPYFVATQFHPELISKTFIPHPLFLGLVEAGLKRQGK